MVAIKEGNGMGERGKGEKLESLISWSGDGYVSVYTSQNLSSFTLRFVHFIISTSIKIRNLQDN